MENTVKNSILVVDDEASNHVFLTSLLSPMYTVYAATNGQSAVKIAKDVLPDLILLDIIMPEIDGYKVLADLSSFEETREIPVIIISGLSSVEDEKKGLALNAVDYISKPFDAEIVKLRIRNQIKIVNQMREIVRLSTTDQLTGIPNRRGFDNQIEREWARMIREKFPMSVLMLDVDKFKNYNDTYGHQHGDIVLQMVAKTMTQTYLRTTDYGARWGGEEFITILPNTNTEGAMDVAERIRTNIENLSIPLPDGESTRVTVSIGVNTHMPNSGDSIEEFIECSDNALYSAKQSGRNRVVHCRDL